MRGKRAARGGRGTKNTAGNRQGPFTRIRVSIDESGVRSYFSVIHGEARELHACDGLATCWLPDNPRGQRLVGITDNLERAFAWVVGQ